MDMKKKILDIITLTFCFGWLFIVVVNLDKATFWIEKMLQKNNQITLEDKNEYFKDDTYQFVKNTDNFLPLSKNDLKSIFYTIVNSGWKKFTFYCPSEYTECLNDVKDMSQNQDLLTHLNNYVHPFNGFSNVKTIISENREITVSIDYFYTEDEIKVINDKVDEILKKQINNSMSTEDKIKAIHDYIINNTKYDVARNNDGKSPYHSYTAYGPLLEGYATCNGYTDAMALFLIKMNIPNFKVAMTPEDNETIDGHVWNAVYLNNNWYHLDLTWDDPVSNDGKDYLQHKYFLITTKELKEIDSGDVPVLEHQFKTSIYPELKEKQA